MMEPRRQTDEHPRETLARAALLCIVCLLLAVRPGTANAGGGGAGKLQAPAQRIEFEDVARNTIALISRVAKVVNASGHAADSYARDDIAIGSGGSDFDGKLIKEELTVELQPASLPALTQLIRQLDRIEATLWVERILLARDGDSPGLFRGTITLATLKLRDYDGPILAADHNNHSKVPDLSPMFPGFNASALFGTIRRAMARHGVTNRLDIDLDRRMTQIEGTVEDVSTVDRLVDALQSHRWADRITKEPVRVESDSSARFELRITLADSPR